MLVIAVINENVDTLLGPEADITLLHQKADISDNTLANQKADGYTPRFEAQYSTSRSQGGDIECYTRQSKGGSTPHSESRFYTSRSEDGDIGYYSPQSEGRY